MTKKSGLADSPFFSLAITAPPSPAETSSSVADPPPSLQPQPEPTIVKSKRRKKALRSLPSIPPEAQSTPDTPLAEAKIAQKKDTTRNITILHFDESDIAQLREATDRVQTYRLTRHEIEWMKDTAYRLSKELKRGKVAQADILRIAIHLFENYLALNKDELIEVLEKMK